MSYSVCDSFPNGHVAGWVDESDGDDWYNLRPAHRWELAVSGLLRQSKNQLELKPDDWDDYTFGTGLNAFQLLEYARRMNNEKQAALA
jgi:hypothetical protein